ncbi:MAG TPA: tRNA pseudouridine(13) synthase TruD [Candidatus Saccharimonadales bacterium]|nr:tRNA pseudouridine(13) synthase TruD [Candidatus Saccharimonadales bacterium]
MAASYHDRLRDGAKLKALTEQDPSLGEAEQPAQFTPEFLKKIGIIQQPITAGNGYIKLHYSDFIVEEITEKGAIASVEAGPLGQPDWDAPAPTDPEKRLRLEVELVKQGFSTFEALERLAEALNLPMNQITYGGLKDGKAITAQRVSVNSITREQLEGVSIPNLFIKNAHYRVGMRNIGELFGNRFTILVRTGELNNEILQTRLDEIKNRGFFNFFSLQRFGSRLLTHHVGKFILQSQYDEAFKLWLVGASPHEGRALQKNRLQAAASWGDWPAMVEQFSAFPYFFQNELKALAVLVQEPGNLIGALEAVGDQIKFAVNAYGSYCFNSVLSAQLAKGQIDETIPQLDPTCVGWYEHYLPNEKLGELRWRHPLLKFLGDTRPRRVPTRVPVTVHSVTAVDEGVIFHFDLTKGAYATTFLAELFQLYQGRPVPDWVNQNVVDTRKRIGYPPISETEEAFPKASLEDLEVGDE